MEEEDLDILDGYISRVEVLQAKLKEYGGHKTGCPAKNAGFIKPSLPCKCGWKEVEQALELSQ